MVFLIILTLVVGTILGSYTRLGAHDWPDAPAQFGAALGLLAAAGAVLAPSQGPAALAAAIVLAVPLAAAAQLWAGRSLAVAVGLAVPVPIIAIVVAVALH